MNIASIIYDKFYKGKRDGIFVECGAIDGVKNNHCLVLQKNHNWVGFNFEPNKYSFKLLEVNRPKDMNINKALSKIDGTTSFFLPKGKYNNKINGGGTLNENLRDDIVEIFNIDTIKFSTFISEYGVSKIDLMILDVEGHELDVLKGFKGSNVLPDIMVIEVNKVDERELDTMMLGLGYKQDKLNIGPINKVYKR